uniref:Uncharacterized protein n=1 Tax=Panagrolaimus sp. JU765 TaxID=591449 RepID=A0AC34QZ59_9BILA
MSISVVNDPQLPAELYEILFRPNQSLTSLLPKMAMTTLHSIKSIEIDLSIPSNHQPWSWNLTSNLINFLYRQ